MTNSKRVLFVLPYPLGRAPSQRFRVEAYFPLLRQAGYPFSIHTFFDDAAWNVLYRKGAALQKAWALIKGFSRRFFMLFFLVPKHEFIFIHREAAPLGPPLLEWIIARLFRKKIIYDFDDAIWIPNTTAVNGVAASLKCFWKVKRICEWASNVSAGNDFLAAYAKQFNAAVLVNPTCVDMEGRYNQTKDQGTSQVTIGWTGSHSTLKYLDTVYPVLEDLSSAFNFRFLVICDKAPSVLLPFMEFRKWNESTEIEDLLEINIGIMPLEHDAWSEGKCGFKIIQYLSLAIPAVASPVGVNQSIVDNKVSGWLCTSGNEWKTALTTLMTDGLLRKKMGMAGQRKMLKHYSLQSNRENFLALFQGWS
ncbi:glycosyltransferase family 4 protein [Flavisolibacter ginsenosidimutans]|uniref:Glycosyltransferase family 4 protein n=1 Tax=Flavisolibacter ginsenosidimutans TaxID=661481 RepID=A0A5B8UIG3_9BACT|nr:glycosyltransferase family 4 protein [Flavisolibacter ginsenosidimutans]QEC56471.1 glycosyltransferase family 4 protein [Flavisolibacter ginsenosidimutans]